MRHHLFIAVGLVATAAAFSSCGLGGCGTTAPTAAPVEPPQIGLTEAKDVVFEERDSDGAMLWRITSTFVTDFGDSMECDSVLLEVTGRGAESFGGGLGKGVGLSARAAKGAVLRGAEKRLFTLHGGFAMETQNGWEIRGDAMSWDGRFIRSERPVTMKRAGMVVSGSGAFIEPARNRFSLRNVRGVFEGVRM